MLTALAAVTERVELGTTVLAAGFRNPALLAKMADTLDEVCGGRLILCTGLLFSCFAAGIAGGEYYCRRDTKAKYSLYIRHGCRNLCQM